MPLLGAAAAPASAAKKAQRQESVVLLWVIKNFWLVATSPVSFRGVGVMRPTLPVVMSSIVAAIGSTGLPPPAPVVPLTVVLPFPPVPLTLVPVVVVSVAPPPPSAPEVLAVVVPLSWQLARNEP